MRRLLAFVFFVLLPLVAFPARAVEHNVHYSLVEEPVRALPRKLVVLPAEVEVHEISAGGVIDLVPQWTQQANDNIRIELQRILSARQDFEAVPLPDLTAEEKELLDQYLASYLVVAIAAHQAAGDSEWTHKRRHFDYTLGEGLAFLRGRTGADAALMLIGDDYVSSQGRKAAMIVGAMLGVGLQGGRSLLSLGVVDLANGDLLWMHHSLSIVNDLTDRSAVAKMLEEILDSYPGLDSARQRR